MMIIEMTLSFEKVYLKVNLCLRKFSVRFLQNDKVQEQNGRKKQTDFSAH